jgi:hypothetical protein
MEPVAEPLPFTVPPPPPPPAVAAGAAVASPVIDAEVGQLTAGWSTVFWVGWLLILSSFIAVWYSSRLIGLSTWWLGPATDPQLILVNLFPLTVPLALAVAGFRAARWLPWWGIGGALFVAGIAVFDIRAVPGYAAIEFALAIGGLCISVASFAGLFRAAPATPAETPFAIPTTTTTAAVSAD